MDINTMKRRLAKITRCYEVVTSVDAATLTFTDKNLSLCCSTIYITMLQFQKFLRSAYSVKLILMASPICWKILEQNKDYLRKSWPDRGIARSCRCDSHKAPNISKIEQAVCNFTKESHSAPSNDLTAW